MNCLYLIVLSLVLTWIVQSTNQTNGQTFNYNYRQSILLRSGFGSIIWQYIDSVDLNLLQLTDSCVHSLQNVNKSLGLGQDWPFKLIEASGRAPSDFTGSGYLDVGNYDQCLGLSWLNNNQSESGQHCLVSVNPVIPGQSTNNQNVFTSKKFIFQEAGFTIKIGFCSPSSCSSNDINSILQKALDSYSWQVTTIDSCQTKQSFVDKFYGLSIGSKISCTILGSFVLLSVICSLIVFLIPNNQLGWIDCFSIQTNCRSTFSPPINTSMSRKIFIYEIIMHFGVLMFHTFTWPLFNQGGSLYGSQHLMIKHKDSLWINIVLSDGLIDGLFIIPGMKHVYQIWSKTDEKTPLAYYINRILRRLICTSLLMALIVNLELVTPLLADGPFVPLIASKRAAICSSTWYSNIIYTQNTYPGIMDACAPHTWSIAIEMKLSLILFGLIYIYKIKPTTGLCLNVGLIASSLIYVCSIFYTRKLEPHAITRGFSLFDFGNWMQYIHLPTINHLWTYLTPILGFYMIKKGFKLNLTTAVHRVKWIAILVTIVLIVFLIPTIWWPLDHYKTPSIVAIYSIFYRLLTIAFYLLLIASTARNELVKQGINANRNNQIKSVTTLNNNQETTKFHMNQNSKIDKLVQTAVTVLRSTYYVHISVFIWYYSSQKWPILTVAEWIGHMFYAILLSILTGLVFQIIILGPFVSLVLSQIGNNLSLIKENNQPTATGTTLIGGKPNNVI